MMHENVTVWVTEHLKLSATFFYEMLAICTRKQWLNSQYCNHVMNNYDERRRGLACKYYINPVIWRCLF
jgi:hypothetical protein